MRNRDDIASAHFISASPTGRTNAPSQQRIAVEASQRVRDSRGPRQYYTEGMGDRGCRAVHTRPEER